jgi:hypothetical protein
VYLDQRAPDRLSHGINQMNVKVDASEQRQLDWNTRLKFGCPHYGIEGAVAWCADNQLGLLLRDGQEAAGIKPPIFVRFERCVLAPD